MADTVSKLVRNTETFRGVEDAAEFAELMYKNFMATGKSAAESNSLVQQLTTSISRGAVDSRALNILFRESPATLRMMADSLGVSMDMLQEMASKGRISAKTLKDVFAANSEGIESRFGELDFSISDAIKNIRNQWGLFVDETDSLLGITKTIANGMVIGFNRVMAVLVRVRTSFERVADRIGGVDRAMKLLAITAGSIFLALNAGKILAFLKTAAQGVGIINIKTLALVAVFVAIALIVDDLINFMQGNDSLMGDLFEKFGIDGDLVREAIQGIMDAAKGLLPLLLGLGKQVGGMLLDAFKQLIPVLMQLVSAILPPLVKIVQRLVPMLVELGRKVLSVLFSAAERILPLLINLAMSLLPIIVGLVERLMPFLFQVVEAILPTLFGIIESVLPLLVQIFEAVLPVGIALIEAIIPLAMEIIDAILPVILELLDAALPLLFQIIDAVLPIIVELVGMLLPLAMQIIEAILPVVLTLIEAILPILKPIIDLVMSLVSSLLPPVISLLNAILPILQPILSILGPIADILGVIIGALGKVVGWVSSGVGAVVDFVGGLFGGGGKPAAGVGKFAKGTASAPDTFIAGEEGPELIAGAKGRKVFTSAATGGIYETLRDIASLGAEPRAGAVSGMVTSIENRAVTQNINVSNVFNGDRAAQKYASKAMDDSTHDLTGALSRALVYAR